MTVPFEERARIDARGRVTIPKSVREALGVEPGDEIVYLVGDDGVTIKRAEGDPVIAHFLDFLARDMERNPGTSIVPLPKELFERINALTRGAVVDLDEDLA